MKIYTEQLVAACGRILTLTERREAIICSDYTARLFPALYQTSVNDSCDIPVLLIASASRFKGAKKVIIPDVVVPACRRWMMKNGFNSGSTLYLKCVEL